MEPTIDHFPTFPNIKLFPSYFHPRTSLRFSLPSRCVFWTRRCTSSSPARRQGWRPSRPWAPGFRRRWSGWNDEPRSWGKRIPCWDAWWSHDSYCIYHIYIYTYQIYIYIYIYNHIHIYISIVSLLFFLLFMYSVLLLIVYLVMMKICWQWKGSQQISTNGKMNSMNWLWK